MKWLLLLFGLMIALPSVHAAATISEIYAAPSEAEKYFGGSGICQDLDTSCNDTQYPSVTDGYQLLGDGATASASSIAVENKSSSQSGYLRLVYHLDGVLDGTYQLRVGHKQGQPSYNNMICAYLPDAKNVNGSSCITASHVDGQQWSEYDVDTLVRRSAVRFDGAVILRYYHTSGTAADVAEVYLKRPFKEADFQIIPQGVTTGDVNQWLENEWVIVSQAEIDLTNASCNVYELGATHVLLNDSYIHKNVSIEQDGSKVTVRWFSNSTVVNPGVNYEVDCDVLAGNAVLLGLEQYVYMTVDGGIFEDLTAVLDSILRLLGLIEDPVYVRQMTMQAPSDGPIDLKVQVTSGEDLYTNAACNTTITDSTGSVLFNQVIMENLNTGIYNFTFANTGGAPYEVQTACMVNDSTDEVRTYWETDSILAGTSEIYEGTPELTIVQSQYFTTSPANILAQLRRGSTMVTDASCSVTTYYPNGTKFIDTQSMSYLGENGLYNYSWTPDFIVGGYPTTVNCSGGGLGALTIQSIGSLTVNDGVRMISIT
jgi:hypothetical protein